MKLITYPIGTKLHRLEIWYRGSFIGEYERSQEADIARKTDEIRAALSILIDVFNTHGQFVVRWNGARRSKIVSVNGVEVATIPINCWRKPSWE